MSETNHAVQSDPTEADSTRLRDEIEGLTAEVEHLRRRLSRSEVVEAELARQHLESQALERRFRRASSQVVAYEALVSRKNVAIDNLRTQVRAERAERRSAERARERAERRRREIERSTSYRLGRRLIRTVGRLAGRDATGTNSGVGGPKLRATAPAKGPEAASTAGDASLEASPTDVLDGVDADGTDVVGDERPAENGAIGVATERDGVRARVVLVDARGLGRDLLAAAVETVGGLGSGVRPVLVLDEPYFDVVRAADLVFEYVPRTEDVAERLGEDVAARLSQTRWQELMDDHQPVEHYVVTTTGSEVRLDLRWSTSWTPS